MAEESSEQLDTQRLEWVLKELSGGTVFHGNWTRESIDAAMRLSKRRMPPVEVASAR